jgi:hypothetical protein
MGSQNVAVLAHWAASVSWEQVGVLVITATGALIAVLLRKHLKKDAGEDVPVKLVFPSF